MITLNLGVIAPCRTNSWFNSAIDNTAFLIKISDDSLSFEPVTAIGYVNLLTVNSSKFSFNFVTVNGFTVQRSNNAATSLAVTIRIDGFAHLFVCYCIINLFA